MTIEKTELSRRSLVKGAAWSLPVIAVAAATPMAAASTTNAGVAWTGTNSNLLSLALLDAGGVVTADLAVTVPDEYTITNGPGAITNEIATITIAVGRPSGINVALGTRYGFGVASVDGIPTSSAERSYDYAQAVGVDVGFPSTLWTGTRSVSVASDGTLVVPVEFGLAGTSTSIAGINVLASFVVNLTVEFADGSQYLAPATTIAVPIGAGVL